jgi:4-hydroxymandelate oxidase
MTAIDDRLAAIHALADFESPARLAMDPGSFDYVAGGAWDEETLAENVAAWCRYRLRPRVLVDVSRLDTSITAFGDRLAMPIAVAPMAAHGLAHPEAEAATVAGAAAAGIPFTLSTVSSCSIEDVAAAAPDAVRWFQLYAQRDPDATRALVERAASAGYRAVVLTVDLPILGYRQRDLRGGFRLDVPLGNFAVAGPTHGYGADVLERLVRQEPGGLTWRDLAAIRSWSPLALVLKGIMTAEDARLAVEHGVDGIVVSNHGGRQLDRVSATADVLPEIVEAVGGRTEIWVDGGVRRGLDVVIALALGARGVLVGRPILWALATGGRAGVERALAILRLEFETAMALVGAPTVADLAPAHVRRV